LITGEEPKMKESTLWLMHLAAGAVMLVVLGIHFGVMHVGGLVDIPRDEVLNFASVDARSGMMFYVLVYLVLLVAALYHGLYGLRSIVFEISAIGPSARRAINVLLVLAGWGFFFYGAWAIIAGYLG
jgi:succinate dehydrogenase / fumarate reductase membrane anchor subunit